VIFVFIVTPNTILIRQQSARPHDNHLDICGVAVVSRGRQGEWGGVECKLYIIIIQSWDMFYSVVYISLQYQYIAVLHSSIGFGIGYRYRWRPMLLDIGYWVPCLVSF